MAAAAQRTHVVLSSDLVAEIDRLVGKRRRSEFIAEAAERELARQRQIHALRRASRRLEGQAPSRVAGRQRLAHPTAP